MFVLYVVSALTMVRSIFRIIEYVQGNAGYILGHEAFLYVFDAVLMVVVMVVFNVVHPVHLLAGAEVRAYEDAGGPVVRMRDVNMGRGKGPSSVEERMVG